MRLTLLIVLLAIITHQTLGLIKGIKIDTKTSTWRDDRNRSRIWHGINFVKKGAVRETYRRFAIELNSQTHTKTHSRFTRRSQRI